MHTMHGQRPTGPVRTRPPHPDASILWDKSRAQVNVGLSYIKLNLTAYSEVFMLHVRVVMPDGKPASFRFSPRTSQVRSALRG
jgi:hypothetical protein